MATSVAQEFYKVRECWASIDKSKNWRLGIWIAAFPDVDIIDKFMETERLPIGVFDDLFFRFDTEYKGDDLAFEQALWAEYASWFEKPLREEFDMYTALANDGLLKAPYAPALAGIPGMQHLFSEILRFKKCITGLEQTDLLLYFPPGRFDGPAIGRWFDKVLEAGVPNGLRLATIDFAAQRKVELSRRSLISGTVVTLSPKLDMMAAIGNEMDKGGGNYDTVSADARFRRQIRKVMSSTTEKSASVVQQEVQKLLAIAREIAKPSVTCGALLIASQAWFALSDYGISLSYVEKALESSGAEVKTGSPGSYADWRNSMQMKAAVLLAMHKRRDAIIVYEALADAATGQGDPFQIMESYRLAGQLYYEESASNAAFETLLLALTAGGYLPLDVRRQSTFLHAAQLALFVGRKDRSRTDVAATEGQLAEWLGDDWKVLLDDESLKKNTLRRKKPLFS